MTKIYDLLISSACNTHIILYLYIRLMFHVPKITTSVSKKKLNEAEKTRNTNKDIYHMFLSRGEWGKINSFIYKSSF